MFCFLFFLKLTEEIHSMLECFARDKLAYTWLTTRKNLFRFHSSFTLSHFIHFLNDRVDLLTKYMECAVCAEDSTSSVEFEKLQVIIRIAFSTKCMLFLLPSFLYLAVLASCV